MLTFLVSEIGKQPYNSNLYPNGHMVLSPSVLEFKPNDTIKVETGLILKCPVHEFIYLVIDNTFNNLLYIENNIIETESFNTYVVSIKNKTNNNIIVNKSNILFHMYAKDKEYLDNTKFDIGKSLNQNDENQIEQSNITISKNCVNIVPLESDLIMDMKADIVAEVITEIPEEISSVVEEISSVVEEISSVVEEVSHVVEEISPVVVEEIAKQIDNNDDINEIELDQISNEDNSNSITLVKRKYIRKKKTDEKSN